MVLVGFESHGEIGTKDVVVVWCLDSCGFRNAQSAHIRVGKRDGITELLAHLMVKNEIAHEGVLLVIEIVGYQSVRLPCAINEVFVTEIIFQIGIVVRETRLDSDFVPFTGIVGAGREEPTGIGRSITVVSHRIKQIVVLAQVARCIEVAAQIGIHSDVMLGVVEVVLVIDVAPIRT